MPNQSRKPLPLWLRVFLTAASLLAVVCFASAFSSPSRGLADVAQQPASPALPGTGTLEAQQARAAAAGSWYRHLQHVSHLAHLARLKAEAQAAAAARAAAARAAKQAAQATQVKAVTVAAVPAAPAYSGSGVLTAAQVGQLWLSAGGPAWAEPKAEEIAYCESGYNPRAYNPSGATGIWQILGSVVPGDLTNPVVNAENAVAKFKAGGSTFSAWVCQ